MTICRKWPYVILKTSYCKMTSFKHKRSWYVESDYWCISYYLNEFQIASVWGQVTEMRWDTSGKFVLFNARRTKRSGQIFSPWGIGNDMIFRIESITCLTLPNTTNKVFPPNLWEEQFRTDELSNINKLNLGFLLW